MSGGPDRVAVQVGSGTVRVAGAEPGREPWLLAELPVDRADAGPDVLRDLLALRPAELLVVHPTGSAPPPASAWAGLADVVRPMPAATAAAAGRACVVLDIGHAGAEVALLAPGGRLVLVRSCPVGGSRLDDAVLELLPARCAAGALPASAPERARLLAQARRVRETLSLLPLAVARLPGHDGDVRIGVAELRTALAAPLGEVVQTVTAVLAATGPGAPPPVLLVGGVARTPLLAELLDDAGVGHVAVAPRPDAAAVLGALLLPAPSVPSPAGGGPAGAPRWLPPPPRGPRRRRAALLTSGGAGATAVLLAMGTALLPPTPDGTAPDVDPAAPGDLLVQYGYAMRLPPGWAHTGGLPERRRTLLTPQTAPEGSDLVSVEQTPLGYDTGAEPERVRAELRAGFDAAVAAGAPLSGFDPAARFAGRPVTAYRQRDASRTVEWFVVLDGDAQLSVGCQYTASGAAEVRRACEAVVASLRRR